MTSTEHSGKLSVHQHPRLGGERFGFCALLLRKSIASTLSQHRSFQCAKCAAIRQGTSARPVSAHHAKEKRRFTRNRWPIISFSASCKPEYDHHSQRCHSHHHGTTYNSSSGPPLCASFRRDPFDTLSLRSPYLIHTDD